MRRRSFEGGFFATAADMVLWIVLAVNVILIVFFFVSPVKPLVIRSDSMEPALPVGSIVIVERVGDVSELKAGDIVTYKNPDIPFTITHRIIKVTEQGFAMKGDNMEKPDGVVKREWIRYRVLGKEDTASLVIGKK